MVVFFMRNELLDYWEFDCWALFPSLGALSLKALVSGEWYKHRRFLLLPGYWEMLGIQLCRFWTSINVDFSTKWRWLLKEISKVFVGTSCSRFSYECQNKVIRFFLTLSGSLQPRVWVSGAHSRARLQHLCITAPCYNPASTNRVRGRGRQAACHF